MPATEAQVQAILPKIMRTADNYHRRFPSGDPWSAALVGLARAANAFDPQRGYAFSTLVYHSVQRQILQDREKTRRSVVATISLDLPDCERGEAFLNEIEGEQDAELLQVGNRAAVEDLVSRVPGRNGEILRLFILQGWTKTQIAAHYGRSREWGRLHVGYAIEELRKRVTPEEAAALVA